MIDPSKYFENQAWIVFHLNQHPIHTDRDGDFNAIALMDVASGIIHGMQMEPAAGALSEFEARLLLKQTLEKTQALVESLYLPDNFDMPGIIKAAKSLNIAVTRKPYQDIYPIIEEAVTGFSEHVSSRRQKT